MNHIDLLPEGSALNSFKVQTWGKNANGDTDTTEAADIAARNAITGAPVVINPPPRQGVWDFESPAVYQWAENPFHESLTQQRIRTDTDLADFYGSWDWNSRNKLLPASYNGSHAPAVGSGAQQLVHTVPGKALHKPSGSSIDDLAVQTPLVPADITFKFLKKNTIGTPTLIPVN